MCESLSTKRDYLDSSANGERNLICKDGLTSLGQFCVAMSAMSHHGQFDSWNLQMIFLKYPYSGVYYGTVLLVKECLNSSGNYSWGLTTPFDVAEKKCTCQRMASVNRPKYRRHLCNKFLYCILITNIMISSVSVIIFEFIDLLTYILVSVGKST